MPPVEPAEQHEEPCDEMPEWRMDDDAIDAWAASQGE
jgi:hypothetical protein